MEASQRLKGMVKSIEREKFALPSAARKCWVYFLHDPAASAIKVGISTGVKGRIACLRGSSPHDTKILGGIEGDRETEELLHRMLAPLSP